MATREIKITPEREPFVEDEIARGAFHDVSQICEVALSALHKKRIKAEEAFRAAVQEGLDDIDVGRVTDFAQPSTLPPRRLAPPKANSYQQSKQAKGSRL